MRVTIIGADSSTLRCGGRGVALVAPAAATGLPPRVFPLSGNFVKREICGLPANNVTVTVAPEPFTETGGWCRCDSAGGRA